MTPSLWHLEILGARQAGQVLGTVQDYLVLYTPDELAQLPQPCDPARLTTPQAVREFASVLSKEQARNPSRSATRQAITAFFAVAAMRLAELAEPDQADQPAPAAEAA